MELRTIVRIFRYRKNKQVMKLLIVLGVFANYTGGYDHAVADAEGKTYRLTTLTKYNVRDTLVKDSTGFIYKK